MSDQSQVLKESFGVPWVRIFSPDGTILRDYDEVPISKYLFDFEYEYNEDEDDICTLKFKFENLRSFNLPYFQQDVILKVQWGYLLRSGEHPIEGPTRKIAIRDLETNYKTDCIELELKCTDIISYLKGFQTTTIRHYDGIPLSETQENALNKSEDNFIDWIGEIGKGLFNTTITRKKQALRIDKIGDRRASNYNPKTGVYTKAIDNTSVVKEFKKVFMAEKVIKGKSMALTHAIEQQLKLMNEQDSGQDGLGGGGPFIKDSTDDTLEIKQRNFHQNIFKTYTYYGGSGELLSFRSNTNTRKEKKDISVSSGINPYTKGVESSTLVVADTKNAGQIPSLKKTEDLTDSEKTQERIKLKNAIDKTFNTNNKPSSESLKQYYKEAREVFKYNINNPLKQKELPDLKYSVTKYMGDPYMGYGGKKETIVTVPTKVVLNMPEFKALVKKEGKNIRAQFSRESILNGYTVERVQRKYEADMDVIGDPSLIKGKVIYINNLGMLDIGKWYIVSCKHKITIGQGYRCELNLIRNPSTIGLSMKRYASNPKFDRLNDKLTFDKDEDGFDMEIYSDIKDENNKTSLDMDSDFESKFREEGEISVVKRLEDLKAEEDFKLGKSGEVLEPISKSSYEDYLKPNNNNY